MRQARYNDKIETLLQKKGVILASDFFEVCEGMPAPSVYSKIRKLIDNGKITVVGKGKYMAVNKLKYCPVISPWMREINDYINSVCIGINHCITERKKNLYIDVLSSEIEQVINALKERYTKTISMKESSRFSGVLEGYIIVGNYVTESPVMDMSGIVVPSLEKELADAFVKGKPAIDDISFQKIMETYAVNNDRLSRYAARRGVSDEVKSAVNALSQNRIEMFSTVQRYLSTIPVIRAWVFGSFARGEEKPDSDLDLLVEYSEDVHLSLLDVVRYKLDLEKLINRDVDLVQDGYLKPFAAATAERDKYLIYAR